MFFGVFKALNQYCDFVSSCGVLKVTFLVYSQFFKLETPLEPFGVEKSNKTYVFFVRLINIDKDSFLLRFQHFKYTFETFRLPLEL